MEKWASKWLEMRSQIHRFLKKFRRRPPDPPLILSPLAVSAARFKTSAVSALPGNNISGSGTEIEYSTELLSIYILFV